VEIQQNLLKNKFYNFMDLIIQFIGVFYLLLQIKNIWKLAPLWILILINTYFFGLLTKEFFFIGPYNLIPQISVTLLFIQAFLLYLNKNKKIGNYLKSFLFIKYSLIFLFFIQVLSLFNTFFNGYNKFESFLFPFLEFVTFIFIPILYVLFRKIEINLMYKFWRLLMRFTILNVILYILNNLGILNFYDKELYIKVVDSDLTRTLQGFPIFLFFLFFETYLRLRKKITFKQALIMFLIFVALILTLTRSLILTFIIVFFIAEIIKLKFTNIIKFIKNSLILAVSVFLLSLVIPSYFLAFQNRLTESANIAEINNVSSRVNVSASRFDKTNELGPLLGIGFVHKNDAPRLNLSYDPDRLIHPDIFWPNLYSTVGIIGSFSFFIFLFLLIKIFLNNIKTSNISLMLFCYVVYCLILSFSGSGLWFRYSSIFVICISLGLYFINYNKRQHIYEYNNLSKK